MEMPAEEQDQAHDALSEHRRRLRDHVLGPHAALAQDDSIARPISEWAESSVWSVWARPGLAIKQRCLVTISVLATLGQIDQLEIHLIAAMRQGWTKEELTEVLLQLACYAGVPVAARAVPVLDRALSRLVTESGT